MKELGELEVNVDELQYTHDSISGQFSDGRSFEGTIADLESGRVDPLKHRNFKLLVVRWPGTRAFFSINNRRTHCLKQWQERVRARGGPMKKVRVQAFELPNGFNALSSHWVFDQFMRSYSTRNEGLEVEVRRGPPRSFRGCPNA